MVSNGSLFLPGVALCVLLGTPRLNDITPECILAARMPLTKDCHSPSAVRILPQFWRWEIQAPSNL